MKEYRTEEYRIYSDKTLNAALSGKLDQADDAFDKYASVANSLSAMGKSSEEIKTALEKIIPGMALSATELGSVRAAVERLLPLLVSGQIREILPRNRFRKVRAVDVSVSRTPSDHILLDGVGTVAIAFHRSLPDNAHVYRVSLKSDCYGGRFYLVYSYFFEQADIAPHPINPDNVVGIDYKQDGLYVDSNGNSAGYPGFRQQGREKLLRYYENAQRFRKGSRRWMKHQRRLGKYEQHIDRQRADWQYKKAGELSRNCDAVCQETLDFRAMIRANPTLAPKIYDNDLPSFSKKLTKKMGEQGKKVVRISRYYPSSQICSYCGNNFGPQPLDLRSFACPFCGAAIDRDLNAARNIKEEGIRLLMAA